MELIQITNQLQPAQKWLLQATQETSQLVAELQNMPTPDFETEATCNAIMEKAGKRFKTIEAERKEKTKPLDKLKEQMMLPESQLKETIAAKKLVMTNWAKRKNELELERQAKEKQAAARQSELDAFQTLVKTKADKYWLDITESMQRNLEAAALLKNFEICELEIEGLHINDETYWKQYIKPTFVHTTQDDYDLKLVRAEVTRLEGLVEPHKEKTREFVKQLKSNHILAMQEKQKLEEERALKQAELKATETAMTVNAAIAVESVVEVKQSNQLVRKEAKIVDLQALFEYALANGLQFKDGAEAEWVKALKTSCTKDNYGVPMPGIVWVDRISYKA